MATEVVGKLKVDPGLGAIICPGHSRPVPDLEFSKPTDDGYFLISSCLDGKPMLREGGTGDWIGTFAGHKGAVWCARLNSTATQAVTASADFTACLWDTISGDELKSFKHSHIVKCSIFSKDGKSIITGGHEKKLRLWDLEKGVESHLMTGHTGPISYVSLCADDNLVVSAGSDETGIKIWDKRTKKVVKELSTDSKITSLSISNDETVLSSTSGKDVQFWDAKSFELIKKHEMPREQSCVAYHPKLKRFITGSSTDLWLYVYNFDTGKEIISHKGHHGPVRCVAFSPNGDAYASGSEDGTIRIWGETENSSTGSSSTDSNDSSTNNANNASSNANSKSTPSKTTESSANKDEKKKS
jgi:serine-threonine kinase receptor-associated protein